MTEQRTFAVAIRSNRRRTTRREQFLTELDQVIPWVTVEAEDGQPDRGLAKNTVRGAPWPLWRTCTGCGPG